MKLLDLVAGSIELYPPKADQANLNEFVIDFLEVVEFYKD